MRSKVKNLNIQDLYRRYERGESSVEIAKTIGCHSATIRKFFQSNGLPIRRDYMRITNSKRTPEQRMEYTKAARAARLGSKSGFEDQCVRAIGVERSAQSGNRILSTYEREFADFLQSGNDSFDIGFQAACGPYNIDIIVNHSVAVEIFGGGFHASGRHIARHQERVRYILDQGWDIIVVWVNKRRGMPWVAAKKEVISLLEFARGNDATTRQYRVIWGTDEILYSLDSKADHFPCVPALGLSRDITTGRYYRSSRKT